LNGDDNDLPYYAHNCYCAANVRYCYGRTFSKNEINTLYLLGTLLDQHLANGCCCTIWPKSVFNIDHRMAFPVIANRYGNGHSVFLLRDVHCLSGLGTDKAKTLDDVRFESLCFDLIVCMECIHLFDQLDGQRYKGLASGS
jgi:hypothetical protein